MDNYSTSIQAVKIYDNICQVRSVAPLCYSIQDCFSNQTLQWMKDIAVNQGNEFEVSRPHRRLLLKPGPDHARLQKIGIDQIPSLKVLTGLDLNLMIVKFWLDLPGFACQPHSDAKDIVVTYQVYVDVWSHDQQPCHGVEFLHTYPSIEITLASNQGYINVNTDQKMHQVLPGVGTRTSVTFQYNLV